MPINNRATPATAQWRTLPLDKWTVTTFTAMLTELTREKYGCDYAPGGGGSKTSRWSREKGMLKNAQGRYGNAVLRKFIELCLEDYAPKADYPFPPFTFMYSYMDRNFAKAQAEVARDDRRAQQEAEVNSGMSADELIDLL
jgi:hypothetical protein